MSIHPDPAGVAQTSGKRLRSRAWFDNPDNPDMTALYLERYLNYGLTLEELRSARPIIGIAQTGSDLSPCNRHHIELAKRVREGIREAGGIAMEFPVHPIQETGKRPTAGLDRNLAYMGLVEVLYGYPLDGVVLTIGCDKTTPACRMAAARLSASLRSPAQPRASTSNWVTFNMAAPANGAGGCLAASSRSSRRAGSG
jgi:dihydroxyacid dehydratase/phosphogluconate dehydratase